MIGQGRLAESILALDCGSVFTRALLIERMEGDYRFIASGEAPATSAPRWNDAMAGVRRALDRLSRVTGRSLLDGGGQILTPEGRRGGVDAVVATTSAGPPLRAVLMGIAGDVSLPSARRALSATYTEVVGTVEQAGEGFGAPCDSVEVQVRLLDELRPDLVVIVGGTDGGGGELALRRSAQVVALACSALPDGKRPTVLYAGDKDLQAKVAGIVSGHADLRSAENVRPSLELEKPGPLQSALDELTREGLTGLRELAAWSPVEIGTTANAFSRSVEYLAALDGVNVLGVDVGGTSVTVASVLEGQLNLAIHTDLGMDRSVSHLLDLAPEQSLERWLPFEVDRSDISAAVLNRGLYRGTLPQTRDDLLLEQGMARTLIQRAFPRAEVFPRYHLIVGRGGVLARAPNYAQAALILLDALQPEGVTGLVLDKLGLLAPLSAVARVNPQAAAQVMERDGMVSLGTVVAPVGDAPLGEVALTVKVGREGGSGYSVDVPYGSLKMLPLPGDHWANLELRPSERFDVGLGARGQAGQTRVRGGFLGIIVDARGRPLPLADNPSEQRERMREWLWSVGA